MRQPRGQLPPPRRRMNRLPEIPLLGDWFELTRTTQLAIVFAYWLYMSAAGLFAGLPVVASLLLSLIFLSVALGCAALYQRARDTSDDGVVGRTLIAASGSLAILFGGLVVILPLIVFFVLALQLLFSIPVWLMRM